jgi:hypothetical protein
MNARLRLARWQARGLVRAIKATPAVRFASRFGGRLAARAGGWLLRKGLAIGIGIGVAALALTPIGWGLGAITLCVAIGVGTTMLVDYAFESLSKLKMFGGEFETSLTGLWQSMKSTAGEWYDTATNAIWGFGRKLVASDVTGASSDLVKLGYETADAYSGHLLSAADGSMRGAATFLAGTTMGIWAWRTKAAVLAAFHPTETVQVAKATLNAAETGFNVASRLTRELVPTPRAVRDTFADETAWKAAGYAGAGLATLKAADMAADGIGHAIGTGLKAGSAAALISYGVTHPTQTYGALKFIGQEASEHPDAALAVGAGGVWMASERFRMQAAAKTSNAAVAWTM